MAYPADGGSSRRPRRRRHSGGFHTARKLRRVRRLVRTGASNRQVTRATARASRAINMAQSRGTYGRQARRQTRRTIRSIRRDNSFYSKQSARAIRRARGSQNVYPGLSNASRKPHRGEKQPDFWPDIKKNRPAKKRPNQPRRPSRGNLNRPRPRLTPKRRHPQREQPRKRMQHPRPKQQHPKKHQGPGKKKNKPNKYKKIKIGKSGQKLRRRLYGVTRQRFYQPSPVAINKQIVQFRKQRKKIQKRIKGPKKEKAAINKLRKRTIKAAKTRGTGAKPLYRKAGLAVGAELDPQLKALKSRIKQVSRNKNRTDKDLKGIYDVAQTALQENKDRVNTRGERALTETENAYDRLKNNLGTSYTNASQDVKDELDRLGIEAVAEEATAGLTRDEKYSLQQANLSETESKSAQRENTEGFQQLMGLLGGELTATGTAARTTAAQGFIDQLMSLKDQKSALAATRHGKIVTAVQALIAARNAAKSERIQQQIALGMANREFGLEKAKFKQDVRNQRFQNRLDRDKFGLDKFEVLSGIKMNQREKRKLKGRREYSNSRGGAVDFLRDRHASGSVIDRYINFVNDPRMKIHTWIGDMNIPILEKNNRIVRIMQKRMKKKGMSPRLARAFADALRIEWGLI